MTPEKAQKELEEGLKGQTPLEVAFYGGTFTSLDKDLQEAYFSLVTPYLDKEVTGIRISTRPDAIEKDHLVALKKKGLKKVELGCQSLDPEVLKKAGRGHSLEDIKRASRLVKEVGLDLGVQQMLGLPGEDFASFKKSLEEILLLEPDFVRLYPTLVLKETGLAQLYREGAYKPLSLEEAIEWASYGLGVYESHKIPVIRIGLQATEDLAEGKDFLAGPYHPSFGQMVKTDFLVHYLLNLLEPGERIQRIEGSGQMVSNLVGQHKRGRKALEKGQGPIAFKNTLDRVLKVQTDKRQIVIGEKDLCI